MHKSGNKQPANNGDRMRILSLMMMILLPASIFVSGICCGGQGAKYEFEIPESNGFEDQQDKALITSMNESEIESGNLRVGVEGPIPPIHPHHQGSVKYSSRMNADGSVVYRRDINAPCDYGMLLFSIGPAADDLPYMYEVYNDAYLFSNNNGLCLLYPSYNGYQTAPHPFWKAMDPMTVIVKPLKSTTMHRISSRSFDPNHSKKKVNPGRIGDYIVIAHHDFYTPHYYQALKASVNSWTNEDEQDLESIILSLDSLVE